MVIFSGRMLMDFRADCQNNSARPKVDPNKGLSSQQVRMKRLAGLGNSTVEDDIETTSQIIKHNIFTYFNLIFAILTVLLIYSGNYRDLTFVPIIICNTLIGIIQELRAKSILDKLSMLNAPVSEVIREGRRKRISSDKLVRDDIAVFYAGDQIPADARIIEGTVAVNESLLTGESDEISKSAGDLLLSGCFIISGSCKAQIEQIGADSYIAKLTREAKKNNKVERSEMIRSLNRLVKTAGILIIPIGLGLFFKEYYSGLTFQNSIRSMVAAVVGMIPEGLFLLSSIALVLSAARLAQNQVLIHDMRCIETLARVDVLCVDKTGTITEPEMQVHSVVDLGARDHRQREELSMLLGDFAAAQAEDNVTMAALKKHFRRKSGRAVLSVSGFSSQYKYSGVNFENASYVLGAPEWILGDHYKRDQKLVEDYSQKGFRVLVFAKYDGLVDGKALTADMMPECLILLDNPIRESAPKTFSFFDSQGVKLLVISGDNPATASEAAKRAGIKNAHRYVDASTLKNEADIEEALKKYVVFGRVTPSQKCDFIHVLKKMGKTTAMTGDGVNDVLALKEADCSVAMASGSDAASQVAQLVLLDSDFSRMPGIVMEGRRVVNNLQNSGSLFIVKNIFSFLMAILSLAIGFQYPVTAAQISLFSCFTIGIPGFLLSQAPNHNLIRGSFMKNIVFNAMPGALADVVLVFVLVAVGNHSAVGTECIATIATAILSGVGMCVLYQMCQPMTKYKWGIIVFCLVGLFLGFTAFHWFFSLSILNFVESIACLIFIGAVIPVYRMMCHLVNSINRTVFEKVENRWKNFRDSRRSSPFVRLVSRF